MSTLGGRVTRELHRKTGRFARRFEHPSLHPPDIISITRWKHGKSTAAAQKKTFHKTKQWEVAQEWVMIFSITPSTRHYRDHMENMEKAQKKNDIFHPGLIFENFKSLGCRSEICIWNMIDPMFDYDKS